MSEKIAKIKHVSEGEDEGDIDLRNNTEKLINSVEQHHCGLAIFFI
jgi:hypothetical protein